MLLDQVGLETVLSLFHLESDLNVLFEFCMRACEIWCTWNNC